MRLPAARTPGRYAVGLVCLGNICRSPIADVVLTDAVAAAGLADRVDVASCGTGDWHVGQPMDPRAAATLTAAGLDPARHRARHLDAAWFEHDVLLVMDHANHHDVLAAGADPDRVLMLRAFDPLDPGAPVPDPYYGGADGFEEVLEMVRRSCRTLVGDLARVL